VFYGITRWGMTAFREQRRKRLAEKSGQDNSPSHSAGSIGSTAR
jgi:hypothetical protein